MCKNLSIEEICTILEDDDSDGHFYSDNSMNGRYWRIN